MTKETETNLNLRAGRPWFISFSENSCRHVSPPHFNGVFHKVATQHIDALVQDCSIPIANALHIMQYCPKPIEISQKLAHMGPINNVTVLVEITAKCQTATCHYRKKNDSLVYWRKICVTKWINDPIVHGLVLYSDSTKPLSLSTGFTLREETDVILHTFCKLNFWNHLLDFGNQTIVDIPLDETNARMVSRTFHFIF